MTPQERQRFWEKVSRTQGTECWLWQGATWRSGVGAVRLGSQRGGDRRMIAAPVVAFFLDCGYWPRTGEKVAHRCGVRRCCNPQHLVLVGGEPGLRALRRGIDPDVVLRLKETGARHEDIAAALGVTRQYIGQILRGKRRKVENAYEIKQI